VAGDDEYDYEVGDLSRWIDSRVKEKANEFTGNDLYQFGDVTKEITRRLKSGDYKLEDIVFLCRILVQFGAGLSPVANILPMKVLMEMLNFSLAQEIGDRLVGAITLEVDKRMKKAITGDAEYQLGDLTKNAMLKFIGKEEYSFGDFSKTVSKIWDEKNETGRGTVETPPVKFFGYDDIDQQESLSSSNSTSNEIDPKLLKEFEQWDLRRKENEE